MCVDGVYDKLTVARKMKYVDTIINIINYLTLLKNIQVSNLPFFCKRYMVRFRYSYSNTSTMRSSHSKPRHTSGIEATNNRRQTRK